VTAGAPYCEIWFRATVPGGGSNTDPNVTLQSIASGTLLGLIRFEAPARIVVATSDQTGRNAHRSHSGRNLGLLK